MKMNALLGVAFGTLLAVRAWAVDEGIDYTELAKPQPTERGEKIEVLEVFMYSCPHCFYLEPTLEEWLAIKPEKVVFDRMPAIFNAKVVPHAKAYYAAEQLGKIEQFHLPLFRTLHENKQAIWDEDALVAFAEAQGIDGKAFRNAYNSFSVDMRMQQARKMGKAFGIDSVPTVIVNGKYRTSPTQAGSRKKMVQVIDYLIGIEAGQPQGEEEASSTRLDIPQTDVFPTTDDVEQAEASGRRQTD